MSGHLSVYSLYTGKIRGIMNGPWKENILISYISQIMSSVWFYATVKFVFGFFVLGFGGLYELKIMFPS